MEGRHSLGIRVLRTSEFCSLSALLPPYTSGMADLSEDVKKAAREAAQGVKEAAGTQTLPAKTESLDEVQTGSPQTPGYQPDYGQTMKEWPKATDQPQPSHDRDRDQDIDR